MNRDLPAALRLALERELQGVSRRDLAARAAKTSEAYRAGEGSAGVIRSAADALGYALARLPATYAACAAVLAEARRAAPDFAPRTLLDAGSGPGAASWAALSAWPDLAGVTWLDVSETFLTLAARLASEAAPALQYAEVVRTDLIDARSWPSADLVVASYALAEVAPSAQAQVVGSLWAASQGVLTLVEPGTPAGFQRIRAARQALIGLGADILAPCPHARGCPMQGADWCHFAVRLPRSRDHRLAKGAQAAFEDEKFAYLLAARPGVAAPSDKPRVLAHPRAGKPGISFKLCGSEGVEVVLVGRRDRAAHAAARRLAWGDVFELD